MHNRASRALVAAAVGGILAILAGCTGSLTPPVDAPGAPPDDEDPPATAAAPAGSATARPMVAKHDYDRPDDRLAGSVFSTY